MGEGDVSTKLNVNSNFMDRYSLEDISHNLSQISQISQISKNPRNPRSLREKTQRKK